MHENNSKRIFGIDGVRGFLLIVMFIDHLLLWPLRNLEEHLGFFYQFAGYVTAAEGFFFLSGFVVAKAYGSVFFRHGPLAAFKKILARVLKIFTLNAAIAFMILTLLELRWVHPRWPTYLYSQVQNLGLWAYVEAFFFINLPWLNDVLMAYVFFLPLSQICFWAHKKGYTHYVALASGSLWLVGQKYPMEKLASMLAKLLNHPVTFGWFDLFAWQMIFVTGLFCGLNQDRLGRFMQRLSKSKAAIVSLSCISLLLAFHRHGGIAWPSSTFIEQATNVRTLSWLRAFNVLCLFSLVSLLWHQLKRFFEWQIWTILGQNSLIVFAYHIAVVYMLDAVQENMMIFTKVQSIVLLITSLAGAYGIIGFKYLFQLAKAYIRPTEDANTSII